MPEYGVLDASFRAAGGEQGIRKLVDEFYHQMQTQSRFKHIWSMHSEDIELTKDKLSLFLMAWLGGPKLYGPKYGGVSIPMIHKEMVVNEREKNDWLGCMHEALKYQDYDQDFKEYLLLQLSRPAERIRQVSRNT